MIFPLLRQYLRSSLLGRILVSQSLLFLGSVALLTVLFLYGQRRALDRELHLRAESMADFLAQQAQFAFLVGDQAEMERLAELMIRAEDVVLVEFASPSRYVKRQRPGARLERKEALAEAIRQVNGPAKGQLMDWENKAETAASLGGVRLLFSTESQNAQFSATARVAIFAAALSLAVILTLQFIQMRRAFRPLSDLIVATQAIGGGDLKHRAAVARPDEIGQLAQAFNEMAGRLSVTTVSKAYVDDIIQSMGEALIVAGSDGRIERVNEACLQLLGFERAGVEGQPIERVLPDFELCAGSGREPSFRRADGALVPVLLSVAELRGEDGRGRGWVVVGQDLTAHKRAERELRAAKDAAEAANKAKSAFLANMTHELRTPLNSVINFAELLGEELEDRDVPELLPDIRKITAAGRHLLGIVSEVLDFSKIEAGRMELQPERFSIREVLSEVAQTAEPLAAKNRNRLRIEAGDADGRVENDMQKFRQSLLNLVSNACKFTREGEVTIRMEAEPGAAAAVYRVEVCDTGIGIEPQQLERLFQPFTQVDASAGRKFGGTGLGLAITRRFCQMMGGELEVQSEAGRGSTFTMRIPAAPPGGQAS